MGFSVLPALATGNTRPVTLPRNCISWLQSTYEPRLGRRLLLWQPRRVMCRSTSTWDRHEGCWDRHGSCWGRYYRGRAGRLIIYRYYLPVQHDFHKGLLRPKKNRPTPVSALAGLFQQEPPAQVEHQGNVWRQTLFFFRKRVFWLQQSGGLIRNAVFFEGAKIPINPCLSGVPCTASVQLMCAALCSTLVGSSLQPRRESLQQPLDPYVDDKRFRALVNHVFRSGFEAGSISRVCIRCSRSASRGQLRGVGDSRLKEEGTQAGRV
jgi:hypothetical protein